VARPAADPNAFTEAVDWFRQRVPMRDVDFDKLVGDAHERAFKVSGVAQLDLVTEVWEALDDALSKGTTLEDFRKSVEARLTRAWGGDQPERVETIFRTNVQHAYSRGRWEQQNDPVVKTLRPFWEYVSVLDSRTTQHCRDWDGKVLRADDAAWLEHNPPAHFRCRATLISLTEKQAQAKGITDMPPTTRASKGFGRAPGAGDWKPDLDKHPAPLAVEAKRKLSVVPPLPKGPAPWTPATSVDEAKAQLEAYGLNISDAVQGAPRFTVPDKKASVADKVEHLNRVGEEVDRIRQRYPWWYEQLKGVTVAEQPGTGSAGIFMIQTRSVIIPRDLPAKRWADTVARCKASGREPSYVQEEAVGWSRMTTRHELAHAIDRNPKPQTFGDEWRFSRADSLFNEVWKLAARVEGKPITALLRAKIGDYSTTSLQERFAESVMMYTSPAYKKGSLPKGVEDVLEEILTKGPQP
jgi:SPP1 gp7 family putative phage head morphogenesis protein